jgi:flavin reductase (DIM6/NTAB) family NADH-FMN oxidoreductase RutF
MKEIDARAFWGAVGQRAMGVSVVTASGADGPAGFLGLSTAHVCADPPMMLVSIDKRTSALRTVLDSRHFAINYLAHGQQAIAEIFGGKSSLKGPDRFSAGAWKTLSSGAPVLQDAAGAIDCILEEAIERFGVVIAIGRVIDFSVSTRDPLIFFRGQSISTPPKKEAAQ